jgi:hypothetical protein
MVMIVRTAAARQQQVSNTANIIEVEKKTRIYED